MKLSHAHTPAWSGCFCSLDHEDYLHCKLCINKKQSRHLPYSLLELRNKRDLHTWLPLRKLLEEKVQKENSRSIMTNKIRKNIAILSVNVFWKYQCKMLLNSWERCSCSKCPFAGHVKKKYSNLKSSFTVKSYMKYSFQFILDLKIFIYR